MIGEVFACSGCGEQASPNVLDASASNHNQRIDMWYVYIIRCFDNTLYTGITNDISHRIDRHNAKKGGSYTRVRTPVVLVYQESRSTKSRALKREAQIKRWSREKKLALIAGDKEKLANLSRSRD
jgi:putative endonuclease